VSLLPGAPKGFDAYKRPTRDGKDLSMALNPDTTSTTGFPSSVMPQAMLMQSESDGSEPRRTTITTFCRELAERPVGVNDQDLSWMWEFARSLQRDCGRAGGCTGPGAAATA
jgi:hypothetical protein